MKKKIKVILIIIFIGLIIFQFFNYIQSLRSPVYPHLVEIRNKVKILRNYLKKTHNTLNIIDQKDIERFLNRSENLIINENKGRYQHNVAVSVDKGDEILICLRDIDTEEPINKLNTAFFIVLHELAHIMCLSEYSHNAEFQKNFYYFIEIATHLGLYSKESFNSNPKYCGTQLNSNYLPSIK